MKKLNHGDYVKKLKGLNQKELAVDVNYLFILVSLNVEDETIVTHDIDYYLVRISKINGNKLECALFDLNFNVIFSRVEFNTKTMNYPNKIEYPDIGEEYDVYLYLI